MTTGPPPSGYPPPRQSSGASTVVKIALGICLGGFLLMVGCAALIVAGSEVGDGTETTSDEEGSRQRPAKIGDTLTLSSNEAGLKMKVKVLSVANPLDTGEFDTPTNPSNRFVGVTVALTNIGDVTYDDAPSNGATVITSGDEQGTSTIVSEGPCATGLDSAVKISPGSRRQGCIPFEVPKGRLKTFQFSLDSGFGPESGEWSLRGG